MFCNIGKFKKYVGKKFLIRSQKDEKFAVDTCHHQKDGGELILWEGDKANPNQVWTVDCMGHIMLAANPKCVIYCPDTANKTRLMMTGQNEIGFEAYDSLARWTLTKEGEIVCQGNPNQMFNACDNKVCNNGVMIMWQKQSATEKNDKWKLDVVGGFDEMKYTPEIGNLKKFVDSKFLIRCQEDEKFVVDSASKQRGGGDTLLWSDTGKNPNQIWTVDKFGHIIHAEKPDELMALVPVKCMKGANVAVVKLTKTGLFNAPIASWNLNDAGELSNLGDPSLILNVKDGKIKNGPAMILWTRQDKSAKNDKWNLTKA